MCLDFVVGMRSHAPCSLFSTGMLELLRGPRCCRRIVVHSRSSGHVKDEGGYLETIGAAHSDLASLIAYLIAVIRDDSHFGIYFRSCVVARNKWPSTCGCCCSQATAFGAPRKIP